MTIGPALKTILTAALLLCPVATFAMDYRLPVGSGRTMPARWSTTQFLAEAFAKNRILAVGEYCHWDRERGTLILDLLSHSLPFRCQDVVVEESPAQAFLEDAYIQPERHQAALKLRPHLETLDTPLFDGLYALNLRRAPQDRVTYIGVEGFQAIPETTAAAWRLFLELDAPTLKATPLAAIVERATDRMGLLAIRDYLNAHGPAIAAQLRTPAQRQNYQLVTTALEDVFRRDDHLEERVSNDVFHRRREELTSQRFAEVLANHPERRFLACWGAGHVERREDDDGFYSLFNYLRDTHAALDSSVFALCLAWSRVDIADIDAPETLGPQHAELLASLHPWHQAHPAATTIPFWEYRILAGRHGRYVPDEPYRDPLVWRGLQAMMTADEPALVLAREHPEFFRPQGLGFDAIVVMPLLHFRPEE